MLQVDESAVVLQGAVVVGDVAIGKDSSVWYNAVLRGDCNCIRIGDRTNIQDNSVVHVGMNQPAIIGNDVTVGHSAIVHGCTIEDNVLIGMGSIVMDGAHIGRDSIIGAGALVTQNTQIPAGVLALGCPAKPIRRLSEEEIARNKFSAEEYVKHARAALDEIPYEKVTH